MITNARKGFTLIEILIVVAIIAILASVVLVGLGPTQRAGRDARRLADLHQVQNGLELYFNRCGFYPGNAAPATGACTANNISGAWATLQANLKTSAGIGVTNIPDDPNTNQHYQYGAPAPYTSYTLAALLEDANNAALTTSVKGTSNGINCDLTGLYCLSL